MTLETLAGFRDLREEDEELMPDTRWLEEDAAPRCLPWLAWDEDDEKPP